MVKEKFVLATEHHLVYLLINYMLFFSNSVQSSTQQAIPTVDVHTGQIQQVQSRLHHITVSYK